MTESIAHFSIPLPRSLESRIYIQLTIRQKAVLLYLTTAAHDDTSPAKPMGSFVCALPDRFNPQQPLATTLFSHEPTLEFTTRVARLLARRTKMPVYVTNSISLEPAGMGGTMEEEMEAFKDIVQVTLSRLEALGVLSATTNGTTS